MNLILLTETDFYHSNCAEIDDRRFVHIKTIQKPSIGDFLKVGILNGDKGVGEVIALSDQAISLRITLSVKPPEPLPITLLLALPRPKMLKRVLQTVSSMGVKELYLINSYRVDKSFWGSPVVEKQIKENLILGLEQAGDTQLPNVYLKKRFKPFIEDELPAISQNSRSLIAHPYEAAPCPPPSREQITLAIGPEGGFIPYEVEKFNQCGFESIHIGERILRVENAVPSLLSRLFEI